MIPSEPTVMVRVRLLVPLVAALMMWLGGCDPGSTEVSVLAYDPVIDTYRIQDVTVRTLDDVGRLEGRATALVGGAELTLDYQDGYLDWEDVGHPVTFSGILHDGVLVPEDFDSLAMMSIYYNIELAMLFFEEIGLDTGRLVLPDTYYAPDFTLVETDGTSSEMTDNAFYMYLSSTERAFFVMPFADFQWVPMAMNTGIMAHEYSHAVFDELVYVPARLTVADMTLASGNFLAGLNEGIADYFAVTLTGDPDFIEHSVPSNTFVVQCNTVAWKDIVRDASRPINYSNALDYTTRNTAALEYCPYDVGSFVASLLYEIATEIDGVDAEEQAPSETTLRRVAAWLLGALDDLGDEITFDFELWDALSLFVARIDSAANRDVACGVIDIRYSMFADQVDGC